MSKSPPDAEQRRAIEQDLESNLFVEAGAGSGKTESLVRRILELFAQGVAQPSEIAVITFTRKAAAELRQRVQVRLEEAGCDEQDAERRKRLQEASTHLGDAFLGTIHSFCARLLREHPFEIGLDPEFSELENSADTSYQHSWENYLARLQLARADLADDLQDLGLQTSDLQRWYLEIAAFSDVQQVKADGVLPDLRPLRRAFEQLLDKLEPLAPNPPVPNGRDALQEVLPDARALLRIGSDSALVEALEAVTNANITLYKWGSQQVGRLARSLRSEFSKEYGEDAIRLFQEYRHAKILEIIEPAGAAAGQDRLRAATLNYQDLLSLTGRLLREHPEVRVVLGQRFRRLLVDEFQDTDPLQVEIMFLLTGQELDETDWRRLTPRPGSLFVVGDPKQSIYRFRRADIAIFREVGQRIEATGGKIVPLTTSFRSVPELTKPITEVFRQLLPEKATEQQAAFAPLQAFRDPVRDHAGGIRTIDLSAKRADDIAEEDAAAIAAFISRALRDQLTIHAREGERPAHPEDFLILLPTRTRIEFYEAALRDANLPARTSRASQFGGSTLVAPLVLLLSALADPDDPVPLLGTLRGPLLGLSDQDLYDWRKSGGRIALYGPPGEGPVGAEIERLRRCRTWTLAEEPAVAVGRMIEDLGLRPWAAGGPDGAREFEALDDLLDVVRQAGDAHPGSFLDAVAALQHVLESGGDADTAGLGGGVRLMNLHQAKGLEAPIVFLANPSPPREHQPSHHVVRAEVPRGYFTFRTEGRGYGAGRLVAAPPGWEQAQRVEEGFADAEKIRLLYVAATRTMQLLVLSRTGTSLGWWQPLEGLTRRAKPLETGSVAVPLRDVLTIAASEIERELEDEASALGKAKELTRRILTVTSLLDSATRAKQDDGIGYGAAWGTAVHRLTALTAQGLARELWPSAAEEIAQEESIEQPAEDLIAAVDRIWNSALGEKIRTASKVMCETPFADYFAEGGVPTVLHGVIDLLLFEEGGWVLVDYKTDRVPPEGPDELVRHYAPQVTRYAEFWQNFGQPLKEALLFFTDTMESVDLARGTEAWQSHSGA